MKTEKLYQNNVYLKESKQKLLALESADGMLRAAFDATIFFPTGGGQLCDTGYIADHKVLKVEETKDGTVWHYLEDSGSELVCEQDYLMKLDWDKRFSHMQMHCGEHLLSGAFLKLFGAQNKGFHMGSDYITIDIDWDGKELTADMVQQAERLANEWIYADMPVAIRWFKNAEEAKSLPCRKDIKNVENISVVLISDEKEIADCCACCGTHPSSTGQIGLVKITHQEKYKSMNRFYVKCGFKALEDYVDKQNALTRLANKHSCDYSELEKILEAAKAREEEVYKKFNNLKSHYMDIEIDKLKLELEQPKEKSIKVFTFNQFDINDLQNMARKLKGEIKDVTVFVSEKENSCILASDGSIDCGKLVKENAQVYSGKGGGKPDLARAIFSNRENIELYLDLIEKHLR